MTRYFLNLSDGSCIVDDEGQEFASLDEARTCAVASAREMLADDVKLGRDLDLAEEIQILEANGPVLATVRFSDVVRISS